MSLAPLDLVSAHPWQRVAFTTYALSLSFFEAVILDALVRGGGSQALILADVQGVRASLSEQGAQRVGKDYEVEPVAVSNGVFHPKVSVLASADECHVLVGSGNLTFGGWGGNCEILEHLHPSFAADAIADAAGFFQAMSESGRIRHSAAGHCAAIATDLRRATQGRSQSGDIRLLHNLDLSISEQIAGFVGDLGGATQLVAAAPFWDAGAAVDRLCQLIGLDRVFLHSHDHGCVEGVGAANWPQASLTKVQAVRLTVLAAEPRRLHAKVFEILCRRGRVVISGSANGTTAALGRDRNVEVCVARVQRERAVGWTYGAAQPPLPQQQTDAADEDVDSRAGVLRAVLDAEDLAGEVLTPKMAGPASVYHMGTVGPEFISETTLTLNGAFRVSAPQLEERSWRGGRLVIRVEQPDGRRAEGFVSVASFADITRRAGLLGRRLFALLAGTETPRDVAAIMAWFHENPGRLTADGPDVSGGGAVTPKADHSEDMIPVITLNPVQPEVIADRHRAGGAHGTWSRFIDQILAAFREPRGPLGRTSAGRAGDDEEDDHNDKASPEPVEDDPSINKSLVAFEKLFALLAKDNATARGVLTAFDLTQYVCDRLQPEPARMKPLLDRLIRMLLNAALPPERREDVGAAVLVVLGNAPEPPALRWARGCLIRLEVDLAGAPPSQDAVRGFMAVFPQRETLAELWPRLAVLRTYPEQVHSYLQALAEGKHSTGYPDLPHEAREEWPVMLEAITSSGARKRLAFVGGATEACPHCHIKLPQSEAQKLRSTGIATAKGCCSRIVIRKGA